MPIVRSTATVLSWKETVLTQRSGDGEYWAPNDDKQNNHEAIVYVHTESLSRRIFIDVVPRHHLCIMTLRDKLFLAPINDPKRILDIGRSIRNPRNEAVC